MLNNISCNSVSMVLVHIIISFNGYLDPIAVGVFSFLCFLWVGQQEGVRWYVCE